MGVVNQSEDLLSVVKDLQRQVRELRRRSLFGAAISDGDLQVRTPSGNTIVRIGQIPYGSSTVSGMAVYRDDGTLQARFFDVGGGGGFWSLHDEQGTIVMSNDTVSGVGLATPYIPYQVMSSADVATPPTLVTAAVLTNTFRVHGQRQHPKLRCLLVVNMAAATVGEVALNQGGTQISTILPVPASTTGYLWLDGTVSGNHLDPVYIDVQARRVSGAGNFRLAVAWASGIQS